MHLEVMYSEPIFQRKRAEETEIDLLPKDNVLCMVLIDESKPIHRGRLVYRWYSKDYYRIGFVGGRFFPDKWDKEDVQLRIRSPKDDHWDIITFERPRPVNSIVFDFEGGYIEPPDWERALKIMNKEMR